MGGDVRPGGVCGRIVASAFMGVMRDSPYPHFFDTYDDSILLSKEVIRMFPVPVVVQAFITGVAAGRQICDLFDD